MAAMRDWLSPAIQGATALAEHGRRMTVTLPDVIRALKRQGVTLYGFDAPVPQHAGASAPLGGWGAKAAKAADAGAAAGRGEGPRGAGHATPFPPAAGARFAEPAGEDAARTHGAAGTSGARGGGAGATILERLWGRVPRTRGKGTPPTVGLTPAPRATLQRSILGALDRAESAPGDTEAGVSPAALLADVARALDLQGHSVTEAAFERELRDLGGRSRLFVGPGGDRVYPTL